MQSIPNDLIRKSMESSLTDTFDTMLAMSLEIVDDHQPAEIGDKRAVATIPFAGAVAGMLQLTLSDALARAASAAGQTLAQDATAAPKALNDVIGELAAIVAGNLKTEFLDAGLTCRAATPAIITGTDFTIDLVELAPPIRSQFRYREHAMQVAWYAREAVDNHQALTGPPSNDAGIERSAGVDIQAATTTAVLDVFHTMLGLEAKAVQEATSACFEATRMVGSVSFAGDIDAMLNIHFKEDLGQAMTAAMPSVEVNGAERRQPIHDVIRAVCSRIGAHVQSSFVDAGCDCMHFAPCIIYGTDFTVAPVTALSPERFCFACGGDILGIETGMLQTTPMPAQAAAPSPSTPLQESDPAGNGALPGTDNDLNLFKNLGLVMDIPLQVTVELGRSRKRINEVLKFGPGSVVELEQMEGEPVDILINRTLIAKGFVVVEKEKYGIRISEIVSRRERMKSIR